MLLNPIRSHRKPLLFEPLEHRLQFAAGFSARINFTTAAGPNVAGYQKDYGAVYTHHSNGLTYGWSADETAGAYFRRSPLKNPVADSNVAMPAGSTWSIKLPAGYYTVHALMGQPGVITGNQRLTAEGQLFVNGEPETNFNFIEGFATVAVADGKLTLAPDSRAVADKLVSVEITSAATPTPTPAGNSISWATTTLNVPVKRVEFSVARFDTKIYSLGGFIDDYKSTTQRFDVFDTKTLTYTQLPDLPGAPTHEAVATDGKYLYAAGGQFGPEKSTDLTAAVWRFDIARNKWQSFGKLPAIHTAGQLVYLDGKLHYIGGDDASRVNAQTTHWVFDLSKSSARWTTAAPLPVPIDHFAALTTHGVIYAIGGEIDHGTSYLSAAGLYAYDPARDKWTIFASMPTAASHAEAATVTDGRSIFVLAGQGNAQQLTSNVYVYNIARHRWTVSTPMPTARKGGIAWLRNSKLYYLTGDDQAQGLRRGGYVGEIQT